jgi:hypothetical protein
MEISFKLLDNSRTIQQKILDAMLPEIKKVMDRGILKIKSNLPNILRSAIQNSPEYQSLQAGKLKYEFGIDNADSKLNSLLTVWSTNIEYQYQQPYIRSSTISGSFSANMVRADFSDVLYTDFAAVVDTMRGYTLPWLEWLLLEGDKTIIKDYSVKFGSNRASRTGYAIMQPSQKSWKVPSEFSGTINDNWITRAIDQATPEIEKMLDGAFI